MNPPGVALSYSSAFPQPNPRLNQFGGAGCVLRDRYEVLQSLGRGGFGITFLAKDITLPGEPQCVIKQLSPKTNNPAALMKASERFEREAKTLAQLGSHAQIPQLLDYFEIAGEFYLVQEYVSGDNLAKEVRKQGPLSEMAVKRFLRDILPVLDYIHQNGVIHRDIKPPNIIRCQDDGRLVLIDFGAVKEDFSALDGSSQRSTTQFVGTVGFAPPEQLSLRPLFSSDIYAIGVTCLYLLTGKPPIEFEVDHYSGQIVWQNDVNISPHFNKVLSKMLKISHSDRYQSAEQVLRALELEPYLDNLSDCMNLKAQPPAVDEPEVKDDYRAPISRTAQRIRELRSRLNAREQRQWNNNSNNSKGMALSSGCYGY